MALKKLMFKPGIYRDNTNYANQGGWYDMDKYGFVLVLLRKLVDGKL
jgi:hypothetical protein